MYGRNARDAAGAQPDATEGDVAVTGVRRLELKPFAANAVKEWPKEPMG